jgi:hypothetical protein
LKVIRARPHAVPLFISALVVDEHPKRLNATSLPTTDDRRPPPTAADRRVVS